jgi:hypothetical protein
MDRDGCDAVIYLAFWAPPLLERLSEAVLHSDSYADRTFLDQAQSILWEFENRYNRSITILMERNQKPVISVHLNSITSGFPEAGGLLPEAIFIALAAGTPPCSIFSRTLIPEGS